MIDILKMNSCNTSPIIINLFHALLSKLLKAKLPISRPCVYIVTSYRCGFPSRTRPHTRPLHFNWQIYRTSGTFPSRTFIKNLRELAQVNAPKTIVEVEGDAGNNANGRYGASYVAGVVLPFLPEGKNDAPFSDQAMIINHPSPMSANKTAPTTEIYVQLFAPPVSLTVFSNNERRGGFSELLVHGSLRKSFIIYGDPHPEVTIVTSRTPRKRQVVKVKLLEVWFSSFGTLIGKVFSFFVTVLTCTASCYVLHLIRVKKRCRIELKSVRKTCL